VLETEREPKAEEEGVLEVSANAVIDVGLLAQKTDGYTGADLENLVRTAMTRAVRESADAPALSTAHLLRALSVCKPSLTEAQIRAYEGARPRIPERTRWLGENKMKKAKTEVKIRAKGLAGYAMAAMGTNYVGRLIMDHPEYGKDIRREFKVYEDEWLCYAPIRIGPTTGTRSRQKSLPEAREEDSAGTEGSKEKPFLRSQRSTSSARTPRPR